MLDVRSLPEPYGRVETWKGRTLTVIVPSDEMRGLVAYIQKLGTNRGAWRDVFEPQTLSASVMTVPRTQEQEARGRPSTSGAASAATGPKGDGNGPVATFLDPRAPGLPARGLQVPHHALGLAAHRRGPLPDR